VPLLAGESQSDLFSGLRRAAGPLSPVPLMNYGLVSTTARRFHQNDACDRQIEGTSNGPVEQRLTCVAPSTQFADGNHGAQRSIVSTTQVAARVLELLRVFSVLGWEHTWGCLLFLGNPSAGITE